MDKTTAQALIIAHLMGGKGFNFQDIGAALAAADPVLFCQLAKLGEQDSQPQWARNAIAFLETQQFVPAIKEVRAGTGMGLKEAKDAVDAMRGSLSTFQVGEISNVSYKALETLRSAAGRYTL